MPELDLIELFVRPLNQLEIRYMVSGSVAAMQYGEPRVTHDVDLIVFLTVNDIVRLAEAYPAPEFYGFIDAGWRSSGKTSVTERNYAPNRRRIESIPPFRTFDTARAVLFKS